MEGNEPTLAEENPREDVPPRLRPSNESPPDSVSTPRPNADDGTPHAVTTEAPIVLADAHVTPAKLLRSEPGFEILSDTEVDRRIRRLSRRSFLWAAVAVAGTWGGIRWLGTRRPDGGVQWPFRLLFRANENLSRDLFSGARLAPVFPRSAATMPRANGDYGVAPEVDSDWQLRLMGLADMSAAEVPDAGEANSSAEETPASDKKRPAFTSGDKKSGPGKGDAAEAQANEEGSDSTSSSSDHEPAVFVTMEQIRALPRTEMVTELKCIEGWSNIVHWAGVRMVDFMRKFPPATKDQSPFDPSRPGNLPEYVSMETPEGDYYVGLDMASAVHPQTLLCYEMNGKPLTPEHGAPLRLAIPVKYGIKNIKNIGKIKYTDDRPKDFWAEQGYDWYAGH